MSDPGMQKTEIPETAETEAEVTVEPARGRRRRARAATTEPSVNMDELRELISLIRENEFTEFELEKEGFRVRFRRSLALDEAHPIAASLPRELPVSVPSVPPIDTNATPPTAPSHPGARAETEAHEDQNLHIIPSPIVGTFYRSASPNSDPFVKIGSRVEGDTVVCIIEAMKLMNEITAETSGEVVKIYVENGQPVEYGQPLFGIKR
jgi:acetyl-CoA carboxylase biotin carboxyl carrier protein